MGSSEESRRVKREEVMVRLTVEEYALLKDTASSKQMPMATLAHDLVVEGLKYPSTKKHNIEEFIAWIESEDSDEPLMKKMKKVWREALQD